MVKINKDLLKRDVSRSNISSVGGSKRSSQIDKPNKNFKFLMTKSRAKMVIEELKALKGEIEEKGDMLLDQLTWERFLDYRASVKEFMEIFVKENHMLKETTGMGVKGRQKVYTLIDKVDKELDKLANAVLEGEDGRIEAMASITEIRGLLMDVFR